LLNVYIYIYILGHHTGQETQVFQPHTLEYIPDEEKYLIQLLETPYQLEPPINRLKRTEVQEVIYSLNPKKSPEYELITGKILI
jgi:hypothetical protein